MRERLRPAIERQHVRPKWPSCYDQCGRYRKPVPYLPALVIVVLGLAIGAVIVL